MDSDDLQANEIKFLLTILAMGGTAPLEEGGDMYAVKKKKKNTCQKKKKIKKSTLLQRGKGQVLEHHLVSIWVHPWNLVFWHVIMNYES